MGQLVDGINIISAWDITINGVDCRLLSQYKGDNF